MKRLFFLNLFLAISISFFNTTLAQSNDEINVFLQDNRAPESQNAYLPAQSAPRTIVGLNEDAVLTCPYVFTTDLSLNSKGPEVRLLQVLLNSDKRTVMAISGPGSPGQETGTFGPATQNGLIKFQQIFLEYVGVANGRFGPRTRTVMNAICNAPKEVNTQTNTPTNTFNAVPSVQVNATPQGQTTIISNDRTPPRVTLSANLSKVNSNATFKVIANFSEEVQPITPDSFILNGATIKEIRKLSKRSFSIVLAPDGSAKEVSAQIEADKIADLAGNTNDQASNEVIVKVVLVDGTASSTLDSIVNTILGSAPSVATSTQVASYDPTRQCYSDSGTLPTGVTETQRCGNPANPANSPYCQPAYQQQFLQQQMLQQQQSQMYGYMPVQQQNPCQNPQAVAQAQQALAQAQQQALQNRQMGNALNSLLGRNGFGQDQNRQQGQQQQQQGQQPPYYQQQQPPAAETDPCKKDKDSKECKDKLEQEKKDKLAREQEEKDLKELEKKCKANPADKECTEACENKKHSWCKSSVGGGGKLDFADANLKDCKSISLSSFSLTFGANDYTIYNNQIQNGSRLSASYHIAKIINGGGDLKDSYILIGEPIYDTGPKKTIPFVDLGKSTDSCFVGQPEKLANRFYCKYGISGAFKSKLIEEQLYKANDQTKFAKCTTPIKNTDKTITCDATNIKDRNDVCYNKKTGDKVICSESERNDPVNKCSKYPL